MGERATRTEQVKDAEGVSWWKVKALDAAGLELHGWAKDKAPGVTRHSPWEWPGFESLTESATTGQLADRMQRNYQMQLDLADYTPLMRKLHLLIHSDKNRQQQECRSLPGPPVTPNSPPAPGFTVKQLQQAMAKPWLAQQLSRLVVNYESEWYDNGSLSKWHELDELAGEEGLPLWQVEKTERIQKLLWWDKLAGKYGLNSTGKAWFLHPVGMVENFGQLFILGKITLEMLKAVFTQTEGKDLILQEIAIDISHNLDKYKLDTRQRLEHFFAQCAIEASMRLVVSEKVGPYREERLKKIFSYFSDHPDEARLYANNASLATQEAIANRAYANRGLNGNVASGDGWRFRGRGLKQLTFRQNYRDFTQYHKSFWGEAVDFELNPDLLADEGKYVLRSAVYFWLKNKLYEEADKGVEKKHIDAITKVINRRTDSYQARWEQFQRIRNAEIFIID